MNNIIAALRQHAAATPRKLAVDDGTQALDYGDVARHATALAVVLKAAAPRVLGLLADNSASWVLADLAAQIAGIPLIPLPLFFSDAQLTHAVRAGGIDEVLTDQPERLAAALGAAVGEARHFHGTLKLVTLGTQAACLQDLPQGTDKVTFTSGTTGEPKGVCLGMAQMQAVALSLQQASAARPDDRHLCLLPLATLLENIGGIYTPLLAGATICVPPLAQVGLSGSSGLDVLRMVQALGQWRATSAIMVPQMLRALVAACEAGAPVPIALRYLSVGGAPVSDTLLQQASALGLPVHEDYGLSEAGSVVAVNHYGANRPGSVGRLLPHTRVSFAPDGEILLHGARWLGYVGEPIAANDAPFATGDTGFLDVDGYLHLTGRKKSIFITAFGRNVAPEWVERELTAHSAVLQAVVFGEGRAFSCAVIFAHPHAAPQLVDVALAQANSRLPDYAQVRGWVRAHQPFSAQNGMLTPNGRPRRAAILAAYRRQLHALHEPTPKETNELLPAA
ncbi:AMP-dependent synthetase/ligase [soil metagenome]